MKYTMGGLKIAYDTYVGQSDFIYFWKPEESFNSVTKACLCQWYPSRFEVDGEYYNCAEQFMMAQKASIMGDEETHKRIMEESAPDIIKKLGRVVKNFDKYKWDSVSYDVVVKGNIAKFSQNMNLLGYLLSTDNKILAEASPYDKVWGIGMIESEALKSCPHKWKGENKLGFALMKVRDILRDYISEALKHKKIRSN